MTDTPRPHTAAVDLSGEALHTAPPMSYGSYLGLEELLAAQHPRSGEHDELLFIIIHQASELWMKLSLHELRAALRQIQADDLGPALKMIARVSRIQAQLIQSWEVLSTMTPADYSLIRPHLGQSSGFQSYQYRHLEFLLGNKNAGMMTVHQGEPAIFAALEESLNAPSLYDEALRLLARRGFDIPREKLERDFAQPYEPDARVQAAWLVVYQDPHRHWELYDLAEKLVDLEYRFQQWRFSHMKTVERIIGFKPGTGGTGGVSYLVKALSLSFFPELLSVRTAL
ncbi:tryptophan 2,3-dioxygenase [Nitrospirillum sp. BR 11163]|uniref:tryptophan 2,3-dioxygenase n=1 Tax=Nitrospirillum sp. BR 11163 TaxID=3104323 RepID=UPI002AFF26B0|nr:tryptophan 2,3-dioxygenase [Nitrospirillum sp. BR 11163]MEA1673095.1 tryptophan 2,3-dioxygenase [Nitrospirillum sp. BR 11163]